MLAIILCRICCVPVCCTKYKVQVCGAVVLPVVLCVWNLVCHVEGGTQPEGVREQGAEEGVWA
jgi:hypothetical protein